jgi:hypothetical protein
MILDVWMIMFVSSVYALPCAYVKSNSGHMDCKFVVHFIWIIIIANSWNDMQTGQF